MLLLRHPDRVENENALSLSIVYCQSVVVGNPSRPWWKIFWHVVETLLARSGNPSLPCVAQTPLVRQNKVFVASRSVAPFILRLLQRTTRDTGRQTSNNTTMITQFFCHEGPQPAVVCVCLFAFCNTIIILEILVLSLSECAPLA